ncbi:hypothetical protein V2G26_019184 [Clonostachys chloroleuca]
MLKVSPMLATSTHASPNSLHYVTPAQNPSFLSLLKRLAEKTSLHQRSRQAVPADSAALVSLLSSRLQQASSTSPIPAPPFAATSGCAVGSSDVFHDYVQIEVLLAKSWASFREDTPKRAPLPSKDVTPATEIADTTSTGFRPYLPRVGLLCSLAHCRLAYCVGWSIADLLNELSHQVSCPTRWAIPSDGLVHGGAGIRMG